MAGAYLIDETNTAVADILSRLEKRRKAKRHRLRRLCVALFVTAVHFVVIYYLVQVRLSAPPPQKAPPRTELLWLLLPKASFSRGTQNDQETEKMIRNAYKAVQLMPEVIRPQSPNAITVNPGLAIGQALSCGAGKFEYLTPEGQRRCRYKPWDFVYDRYGYVILDPSGAPAQKQPEKKVRPSDAMAHERNTRPHCASYIDPNAPCLENYVPGGNN